MNYTVAAPITWFGSKSRLIKQIIKHFPDHTTFIDVFGGSGAVLLGKKPSKIEVYNDINFKLANLFKVLSDKNKTKMLVEQLEFTPYSRSEFENCRDTVDNELDEIELARKFIVVHRQSFAGLGKTWSYSIDDVKNNCSSSVRKFHAGIERLQSIHYRIRRVQIENLPWQQLLKKYDRESSLFYLDPPYLPETRIGGGYEFDFIVNDHVELLESIKQIKGMCIISGYYSPLYAHLEDIGFTRVDIETISSVQKNKSARVESLWISPSCVKNENINRDEPKNTRQSHAYNLHKQRVLSSEKEIKSAIKSLKSIGKRVTKTEVSKLTGISRVQISRRYQYLFDL